MDPQALSLNNAELLEQIGTLLWATTGNASLTQELAKLRIGYELYQRLSGERELEALRNQTILNIAKWLQQNPKAPKEEVAKEIGKQITKFAELVEKM